MQQSATDLQDTRVWRKAAALRTAGRLVLPLLLATALLQAHAAKPKSEEPLSVVRLTVTSQSYDFFRPWSKKAPVSLRALAPVLEGNRVLVKAQLVRNRTFVELERADRAKMPGRVVAVDYEANLALIAPTDPSFLQDLKPLQLTNSLEKGDELEVWQLQETGDLATTSVRLTNIEVGPYALESVGMLMYRLSGSIRLRTTGANLPLVKDGKLAGLIMRYEGGSQSMDAIAGPVIEHFLKAIRNGDYNGFPSIGISFTDLRDPQLRRYVGLNDENKGGVYISEVEPGGPADKGGLKQGDVLLALNGYEVDSDGNYEDPDYGKLGTSHLIKTKSFGGETAKLKVFREGETLELEVVTGRRKPEDYVSAPYTIDRAPKYYVLGGLLFQELSRQYLKEWGSTWVRRAPQHLVYLDRYQSTLFPNLDRKVVFLSKVLQSPSTIGYKDLRHLVVTKVNGKKILSLADLAEAAKNPVEGYHQIEFEDDPKEIYLDAAEVANQADRLRAIYGLPTLQRLD